MPVRLFGYSDAGPKHVQPHRHRLPERTNNSQDIGSATTSASHVQAHLISRMHMCLNVGGTYPKVGRRVLADGFEFASFQHLHVLVPCCCNNTAAEFVWGVFAI
jgi:hypothetical protein